MSTLDYIVIVVFSLIVLVAGLSFTRSGTSMRSFFAAGGNLPWWMSGLSLFMSFFSAGTFVVWGSIAYELGWVAITLQWIMGLAGFITGLWIAPKWRKTGVLTVGEFLGKRYGNRLKDFYSYSFLGLSVVTTGAFLYPVAKLFNVASGFSIEISVVALGLVVVAYTAAGGLWAVIVTDVLQFVILFAAVLIGIPLAFGMIGGIEEFTSHTPKGFFDLVSGEYSPLFLFAFLLYNIIYISGNWAYVQRYTSVSSPQSARKVGLLFGALYLLAPVLWMVLPMIYRVMEGGGLVGLESEGAFLLVSKEVLPMGMLGLMLGGMIFATASSVNTTLNMSAAVFTNDIYKRLKPRASDRNLMTVARLATIVFGMFTIAMALTVPTLGGIVEVVLSVGAITGAPLFAPAIWALFSNRQTSGSILAASLSGLGVNLFLKFMAPALLGFALDRGEEMMIGVITTLMILGLAEIINKSNPAGAPKPATSEGARTVDSNQTYDPNKFAIRVLGNCLALTGILMGVLGAIAESGQEAVIPVAMVVLVIGIALRFKR